MIVYGSNTPLSLSLPLFSRSIYLPVPCSVGPMSQSIPSSNNTSICLQQQQQQQQQQDQPSSNQSVQPAPAKPANPSPNTTTQQPNHQWQQQPQSQQQQYVPVHPIPSLVTTKLTPPQPSTVLTGWQRFASVFREAHPIGRAPRYLKAHDLPGAMYYARRLGRAGTMFVPAMVMFCKFFPALLSF